MPLKCWTRQGGATGQYVTCKNTGENNNLKNKSKKNIVTKKMPPKKQAKTIDEEINNLMNTPSMKKVNAKPDKPKKQASKGDVDKEIDNLMKTKTMKKVNAKLDLDKLPPAKTEKNKKFLSYVTDNRKIKIKQDVNKRGKSLERYNKYKSAKTVVQMIEKGGTFYDLINDVEKGIIVIGSK